jgi:hypothetical protein
MTLIERLALPDMQGLNDTAAARVLNTRDPALPLRRVDVATADAREILLATGEWAAVVMSAENAEVSQILRRACINLRDTIENTELIRATSPEIYAATAVLLGGMVAEGVLTQATVNLLMALADRPQSWAEANETEVTARTVGLARGAN